MNRGPALLRHLCRSVRGLLSLLFFVALLKTEDIDLHFTDEAIREIARGKQKRRRGRDRRERTSLSP